MEWTAYFRHYLTGVFPAVLQEGPWKYKDDLCMLGANALLEATGDETYWRAMEHAAPFLLPHDGHALTFGRQEHNLDKISFGKSLLLLYRHTAEEKYRDAAMGCYDRLMNHPRTKTGVFIHKDIYPHQVWLDGQYMALPFYAACEKLLGSLRFDDVIDQFEAVRSKLYVPEARLYAHAWDESRTAEWSDAQTGRSPSFWLRAIGWYLMALCDVFEIAAPYTRRAESLALLLREAVEGLMPYQDPQSGMFLQLVNRKDLDDNYPETSGSAMAAYAMLKGARLGMLDRTYGDIGLGVLSAVALRYLKAEADGPHLYGICASAGLGPGPDNRSDPRWNKPVLSQRAADTG